MKILLTILQAILALHTAVGAMWKLSNSERSMPSLGAIPHGVWLGMGVLDMLCAIALIVPLFNKRAGTQASIVAATLVAVEMLIFCGVHLASGSTNIGPILYWLGVAAVCGIVAYGRLVLKPVRRSEFASR